MKRTKRWVALVFAGMLTLSKAGVYAEELSDGAAVEEIMSETEELPVIGTSGITDYDLSVTVGGTQSITCKVSTFLKRIIPDDFQAFRQNDIGNPSVLEGVLFDIC